METFMLVDSPVLSAVIWLLLAVTALYLARSSSRRAILAIARAGHSALRLSARAVETTGARLKARNREVLLAQGREAKERLISREFERITATVNRDLARYPETQRLLTETIARIDEDHHSSTEVPPEVPGWTRAVEAIGKLSGKADASTRDILEAIHGSLVKAERRSLELYRAASRERHRLLSRMLPRWQRIQATLKQMDRSVSSILERAQTIDRHMDEYQEVVRGTDRAAQALSTSALVQFAIASLVLAIAVGGAIINFSLIARPMAEMVGGTSYIGPFQTADIAALVIILVEMSMGLFLMESLRITRLFPVIAALPDQTRKAMAWIALILLTILASVEAGLAYMREVLLQDELATASLLRGAGEAALSNEALWITTAAQMGMGFILPFALTFVAIPLETFVTTLRHVLGLLLVTLASAFAFSLRLAGNMVRQTGNVLLHVYDMLIFAPLWLEHRAARRAARREAAARERDVLADAVTRQDDSNAGEDVTLTGYRYGGTPA